MRCCGLCLGRGWASALSPAQWAARLRRLFARPPVAAGDAAVGAGAAASGGDGRALGAAPGGSSRKLEKAQAAADAQRLRQQASELSNSSSSAPAAAAAAAASATAAAASAAAMAAPGRDDDAALPVTAADAAAAAAAAAEAGGGGCCWRGKAVPKVEALTLSQRLTREAAIQTAGIPDADLIYINYDNMLEGLLPYLVALDCQRRRVVVAVRGSLSVEDCVTGEGRGWRWW